MAFSNTLTIDDGSVERGFTTTSVGANQTIRVGTHVTSTAREPERLTLGSQVTPAKGANPEIQRTLQKIEKTKLDADGKAHTLSASLQVVLPDTPVFDEDDVTFYTNILLTGAVNIDGADSVGTVQRRLLRGEH